MRKERGKIEGDLALEDALEFYGIVTGNTHVSGGATLELFGTCCRDLVLVDGAEVRVYGTVAGNIYNRGGQLTVFGVVNGNLSTLAGETTIDSNAVIEGDVQDDT